MQQLKPADHSQCLRYVEWALEQQAVDGNFSNKIFFSDEAHFTLDGCVNKQMCRVFDSDNSQVIEKRPLHPEKVSLLLFLVRRFDWTLLFRKRRWNDCRRQFGALWSYNNRLFFAIEEYDLAKLLAVAISTGHQDHAIRHH